MTSEMRPLYRACTSCHTGAVKGWCVLLHLPFARRSFSVSARVNNGNSVIQRKCGVRVGLYVPAQQVSLKEGSHRLFSTYHATEPTLPDEVSADQVLSIPPEKDRKMAEPKVDGKTWFHLWSIALFPHPHDITCL